METVEVEAPRYEAQEIPFGRVYKWLPPKVALECSCGNLCVFTRARDARCALCQRDHAAAVEEGIAQADGEGLMHPWQDWTELAEAIPY